jgi:hypothetical protein
MPDDDPPKRAAALSLPIGVLGLAGLAALRETQRRSPMLESDGTSNFMR